MPPPLRVFVAPGCAGCARALELAAFVGRRRPTHSVEVVDLTDPRARVPDSVVGTPAFLIGDRLFSLGNPDPERLLTEIDHINEATG
ncbi:thioredoxin family protein [Nocardiopsis sp. EMB25]|uniref:thioredoxin family protein n=1 Tax=Nocardiopsis sp. EMB25 TaxID=2835867 RepID=UPI002283F51F|nr:thioredoxin family protein [Nocardiopsis sp. EMB25]MCY9785246.1 thioredoxin family protein [Nocardiopsis sp. EMB25]